MKKSKKSLKDIWDTIKWAKICTMRVPERKQKKEYVNKY